MCLTFIFKVKHQGQVTNFGFSEILDLANVRIDTKIKSVTCIQPEIRKVIQLICVTLSSKVNRQGHMIFLNIFDIHDLENVRIDTKINFVSCLQQEMRKVMQKDVWPWFSRSCNKDRIFSLSPLDFLTPKTYPWEIFLKNLDGKTKIQGGYTNPPLGVRRWIFTLGIWGLRYFKMNRIFLKTMQQLETVSHLISHLALRQSQSMIPPLHSLLFPVVYPKVPYLAHSFLLSILLLLARWSQKIPSNTICMLMTPSCISLHSYKFCSMSWNTYHHFHWHSFLDELEQTAPQSI